MKDIIKLTSSKPVEKPKKDIPPAIEPDNEKKYLSSLKPNTLTSNEKKMKSLSKSKYLYRIMIQSHYQRSNHQKNYYQNSNHQRSKYQNNHYHH